jgi:hypothetical protein
VNRYPPGPRGGLFGLGVLRRINADVLGYRPGNDATTPVP